MAIGRTEYTAAAVAAARSVLLELTHLLGQYRDDIVVVGGWVPELLLPQAQVVFCLRHYPGGIAALIEDFRPYLLHGLVQEGLKGLAEKFASPNHVGPKFVADFDETVDPDARALTQRDAYERVHALLQGLGIS